MSPYEELEAAYLARPRAEPFENYVRAHLRCGFVFSRPDVFVMGRPVPRHAPAEAILDSTVEFPREVCDCWYLFALAGSMPDSWRLVPWELPWFCWVRLGDKQQELTFVEADRLRRLCPPSLNPAKI